MDTESEHALDALLRCEIHGWVGGADAAVAAVGARRSRLALANAASAFVVSVARPIAVGRSGRADWDSEHFGREIHRFDDLALARGAPLRECERAADALVSALVDSSAAADLIFARVPFDAVPLIRALEGAGFRTFDAQTTWVGAGPPDAPVTDARVSLRAGGAADADAFAKIAATAMSEAPTHLHADPALERELVDALYAAWGRNQVVGGLADHSAVAMVDGEVAGFATAKVQGAGERAEARLGVIPLVAVDARHRGRGIARAVVASALAWLGEQGVATCAVGTQVNNVPAARLYAGLGLRPALSVVNLHRARTSSAA